MRKIRIFIDERNLHPSLQVKIVEGDFEYLTKVMRQKIGDSIFVFNGLYGDFLAEITSIEKRSLNILIKEKVSDLKSVPNFTLAFAPTKNVGIDFIAKKGVEMGVASFQPIITARTIVDKINEKRLKSNVKEGLEQCERNDFPKILEIKKLDKLLAEDALQRIFILCDESGDAKKAADILPGVKKFAKISESSKPEIVILIGPEGGFTPEEFARMRLLENLFSINLGPRILRADTAMIAALAVIQEQLGDW